MYIYLSSYDTIGIYLKIIVMRLVAKPFPIYSECSYVSTFVIHNDNTFPRHGDILWRRKSIWCFQRSQKISKSRVYENWSVWKERMKLIIHNPFLFIESRNRDYNKIRKRPSQAQRK